MLSNLSSYDWYQLQNACVTVGFEGAQRLGRLTVSIFRTPKELREAFESCRPLCCGFQEE